MLITETGSPIFRYRCHLGKITHLDQEINDRGIGVDMELVRQAIVMDARSRERLTATPCGTDGTGITRIPYSR